MGERGSTRKIVDAIARRHHGRDLVATLAEALSPSELASMLLHTFRERARRTGFAEILRFAERSALVRPSEADARLCHRFDALAFEAAAEFDVLELSPVSVFGMNALAGVDQNNVLTASRNSEVVADPTTALAVESAIRRRRGDRSRTLRFATSHRLVRMQPFDDPGFSRHFRLFALAHAGRDQGSERFELDALKEQITVWLRLAALLEAKGFDVHGARVEVSDTRIVSAMLTEAGVALDALRGYVSPSKENTVRSRFGLDWPAPAEDPAAALPIDRIADRKRMERVRDDVFAPIRAAYPAAELRFDFQKLHGLRYYDGLTLTVIYKTSSGDRTLIDGGFSSWTQALLTDKKERFLASAIGSEAVVKMLAPR